MRAFQPLPDEALRELIAKRAEEYRWGVPEVLRIYVPTGEREAFFDEYLDGCDRVVLDDTLSALVGPPVLELPYLKPGQVMLEARMNDGVRAAGFVSEFIKQWGGGLSPAGTEV